MNFSIADIEKETLLRSFQPANLKSKHSYPATKPDGRP